MIQKKVSIALFVTVLLLTNFSTSAQDIIGKPKSMRRMADARHAVGPKYCLTQQHWRLVALADSQPEKGVNLRRRRVDEFAKPPTSKLVANFF